MGELEKILATIFRVHILAHRKLQPLFPKVAISAITPEMLQLLMALREKHYQKCPNCVKDEPGFIYSSQGRIQCPTCKGANWIPKNVT